jgi:hypothetical protein
MYIVLDKATAIYIIALICSEHSEELQTNVVWCDNNNIYVNADIGTRKQKTSAHVSFLLFNI